MSRVPRIRFKGFEEDWEQRKLGEIGMIITGSTPSTSLKYYYTDDSDEGIVWVTPTDIINNITVESEKRLTSLGQKVAHIVPQNTILVTCIASIGKNTMLIDRGSFNQQINGLIPYENKYEPYFLLTESFIWSNKMKSSAPAGTMQIVNRKEFSEIDAGIPNKSEQNSVGSFFRTLDHLITLHQRKLEKLKIIKKSMLENLFPQNGEKTPKIRFSGFTKDWEQRKHGEVFIYLRNNTLSREELNDEDGFAQSIHYGDVLIKYGECLNVSKELLPYIDNKNIVNKFKKFYTQNGDVIIADTAEDETVGKCIEISGIVDHNVISGLHTIPLRPVNKFAYGYLGFYLNSNSYHNQLKPLMQGIKVTSISKNLLKTTTLNYPSNIQEQKIIGRYFDALNHLITLHQSKLEKLQKIKKSMLESMFV